MTVARKCENCGNVDTRVTWKSNGDAAKDPAFEQFTCPRCAWTEFDLVEAAPEAANA